jgi:hypothetical protein
MTRGAQFGTIWRKEFDPELVQVPPEQYRDYVPMVEIRPRAVYDPAVIELDLAFKQALSRFLAIIEQLAGAPISMPQLIAQIPQIIRGTARVLRIFSGGRMVGQVPLSRRLREACASIQAVIQERLLLFEDMVGTFTTEEIGRWGEVGGRLRFESSSHQFRDGAKLLAIVDIVKRMPRTPVFVFVRYKAVAEALAAALVGQGIATTFVYAELEDRNRRVEQFKGGEFRVLVATRQLFGRGFDLPEAKAAIFYSPKRSVHTMWQEMLRIRGTVLHAKAVFLLFYAWTAEETKASMFLRDALATGARQAKFGLRWRYSEEEDAAAAPEFGAAEDEGFGDEEFEDADDFADESMEDDQPPAAPAEAPDGVAATRVFVRSLLRNMTGFRKETVQAIDAALWQIAQESRFSTAWPVEVVSTFLPALASTLSTLINDDRIKKRDCLVRLMSLVHPDKHADARGTEVEFWHQLSVNLTASLS